MIYYAVESIVTDNHKYNVDKIMQTKEQLQQIVLQLKARKYELIKEQENT